MTRPSLPQRSPDNWLVTLLVALMKFWCFVGLATVKAARVLVEDPEVESAFRALFDHTNDESEGNAEQPTYGPPTSTTMDFANETKPEIPGMQTQEQQDATVKTFYVVTVGLDVGITNISAVAHNLTSGVAGNCQQHFESREEAIVHYLSSLRNGDVHRICTTTLSNGHVERYTETLDFNEELRDLDVCLAVGGATVLRQLHGLLPGAMQGSHYVPFTQCPDTDRNMMSDEWFATRMPCPTSTPVSSEGLVCPTSTPVSLNGLVCVTQTEIGRVIVLSDDDESETSQQVQGEENALDVAELSTHSSDIYYSSDLDPAIEAVIAEEDTALAVNREE